MTAELSALRADYAKLVAIVGGIETKLAAADLEIASARHDFQGLRSGLLVMLNELDRLDPQNGAAPAKRRYGVGVGAPSGLPRGGAGRVTGQTPAGVLVWRVGMALLTLGGIGSFTLRQAAGKAQDAIDWGELVAQRAPAGAAIFAALDDARETRDWVNEQIPMFLDDGPALPNVSAAVDRVCEAVYTAGAAVRNDPSLPLSPTIYQQGGRMPWATIAVAGAAVLGAIALFVVRPAWLS
jgi:hypothetical protein